MSYNLFGLRIEMDTKLLVKSNEYIEGEHLHESDLVFMSFQAWTSHEEACSVGAQGRVCEWCWGIF